MDQFVVDVEAGVPAFIRVMTYTFEGDPIITDYKFDGKVFIVTIDNTRDMFSSTKSRKIESFKYPYDEWDNIRPDKGIPILDTYSFK